MSRRSHWVRVWDSDPSLLARRGSPSLWSRSSVADRGVSEKVVSSPTTPEGNGKDWA